MRETRKYYFHNAENVHGIEGIIKDMVLKYGSVDVEVTFTSDEYNPTQHKEMFGK